MFFNLNLLRQQYKEFEIPIFFEFLIQEKTRNKNFKIKSTWRKVQKWSLFGKSGQKTLKDQKKKFEIELIMLNTRKLIAFSNELKTSQANGRFFS